MNRAVIAVAGSSAVASAMAGCGSDSTSNRPTGRKVGGTAAIYRRQTIEGDPSLTEGNPSCLFSVEVNDRFTGALQVLVGPAQIA